MTVTLAAALISMLAALPPAHAEPVYPMQAEEVSPGVYAVITPSRDLPNPDNGGWNSNSGFVVTGEGVLLVDTGSSTGIGEALRRTIAGVTDQPVRWIVNTHAHGDHWLGNAAFASTVRHIYASSAVAESIGADARYWIDSFNQMTGGATGESEPLPPDTLIDERTEFVFGDRQVVMFPSGNSHSPGDLIVWLPDARVLISGDVVYSDRMPSTNASDLRNWIAMLEELTALDPAVVIPGHGAVTDRSGLVRLHELLGLFWESVTAHYENGLADYEMVPAVTEALARFEPHYPGLQEKLERDISHVYLQVEAASF